MGWLSFCSRLWDRQLFRYYFRTNYLSLGGDWGISSNDGRYCAGFIRIDWGVAAFGVLVRRLNRVSDGPHEPCWQPRFESYFTNGLGCLFIFGQAMRYARGWRPSWSYLSAIGCPLGLGAAILR